MICMSGVPGCNTPNAKTSRMLEDGDGRNEDDGEGVVNAGHA
jgi:hypothetical protein